MRLFVSVYGFLCLEKNNQFIFFIFFIFYFLCNYLRWGEEGGQERFYFNMQNKRMRNFGRERGRVDAPIYTVEKRN